MIKTWGDVLLITGVCSLISPETTNITAWLILLWRKHILWTAWIVLSVWFQNGRKGMLFSWVMGDPNHIFTQPWNLQWSHNMWLDQYLFSTTTSHYCRCKRNSHAHTEWVVKDAGHSMSRLITGAGNCSQSYKNMEGNSCGDQLSSELIQQFY